MRNNPLLEALLFFGVSMALLVAAGPVVGILASMMRISKVPVWLYSSIFSLLMAGATAFALRREGGFGALGLTFATHRVREFALGFVATAILFGMVAVVRGAIVGASWSFTGVNTLPAAATGLFVALVLLLPEELLFRGYAFRRLIESVGAWPAIGISALLFGVYHLIGVPMWGIGAFFQVAMPALGGVVFGWAAVRTRGLALPIGLHLGGNWIQASVLSFQPGSGALWTSQLTETQQRWLFAPDLVPHLPYISALLIAAVAVRMAFTDAAAVSADHAGI